MSVEELPASKLGTKEYWDTLYEREVKNFKTNKEDEGEVWFGHSCMMKVVNWILKNDKIDFSTPILDIGCGNGVFLIELAEEGFDNLHGVDYSHKAIELAKSIALEHETKITYNQVDLVDSKSTSETLKGIQYDVCHDKGTYDAVSLNPDDAKGCRVKYINTLHSILKDGGLYIITSCNWTLDELLMQFSSHFQLVVHIPAPTFQFGGKTGSPTTTAVFSKL